MFLFWCDVADLRRRFHASSNTLTVPVIFNLPQMKGYILKEFVPSIDRLLGLLINNTFQEIRKEAVVPIQETTPSLSRGN
jgi:hypothetical protein